MESKQRTVYLIMQPTVKRNGELPNLETLKEYGPVQVLVLAGEYPTKDPQRCLDLIRHRLRNFKAETDYLVWVGGDTLAAVLTGVVLADMSYAQEHDIAVFDEITWLRYHRPRDPEGNRTDKGARYFPVKAPMWASDQFSDEWEEDEG